MSDSNQSKSNSKGAGKKLSPLVVALQYDVGKDDVPRIVAGGHGTVAQQILELAFANNIRVREDADLAELLSSLDIESEIPPEVFATVAEILIYVYRANKHWPEFLAEYAEESVNKEKSSSDIQKDDKE